MPSTLRTAATRAEQGTQQAPKLAAVSHAATARFGLTLVVPAALWTLVAEGPCLAQLPPACVPGTPLCARATGNGGVQAGGQVQGRVGPNGAAVDANGNASGNANGVANANASGNANGTGAATGAASGNGAATGNGSGSWNGGAAGNGNAGAGVGSSGNGSYAGQGWGSGGGAAGGPSGSSEPIRFGAGLNLCGTIKAGVWSGVKGGPCFAVSFRTERLTFEMETQLLVGGVRHSVDWVFPMSFVIPLTTQRSLYEGLQLRVGGSPIGVTFARARDGGNYIRFGLHAGLSYEWGMSDALTWRVFDARVFLDFGTKREVDLHDDFLDFGGQLSTGIVF